MLNCEGEMGEILTRSRQGAEREGVLPGGFEGLQIPSCLPRDPTPGSQSPGFKETLRRLRVIPGGVVESSVHFSVPQ